jgi:multicomponent Na+:H+ antiporter subunit D
MYKTGRSYIHELDGFGRRMPKVFTCFTVSALALMGVPGLCGFVSKWNLAKAAVASENPLAYAGVAALLISALLTAIYMLTIVVRAFFPGKDFDYGSIRDVEDPNWMMLVPLFLFVAVIVLFGLHSGPVIELLRGVAGVV